VPVDDRAGLAYRPRGEEGRVYLDSMGLETVTVLSCSGKVFAAVFAAGVVDSELLRGGSGGAKGVE
jgi:hypothetical protein